MNFEMDEELAKLLAQKEFENLTVEEKDYVLQIMTEQDYVAFKSITDYSGYVLNEGFIKIKPNLEIKHNLSKAYRRSYSNKNSSNRPLLAIGVEKLLETPFYKFATLGMACMLLIFSAFVFGGGSLEQNDKTEYTSMDVNEIDGFYEMNSYLYLEESGLDVKIIIPGINDALLVESNDSLLIP